MKRIINRKLYDTDTATEICCDGVLNRNGCTRCSELYKTIKGNFFLWHKTMWQGEEDSIEPVSENYAADFYEKCTDVNFPFEEVFPGIKIEEA